MTPIPSPASRPDNSTCPFFEPAPGGAGQRQCLALSPSAGVASGYAAAYCTGEGHVNCNLYVAAREAAQGGEVLLRDAAAPTPLVTSTEDALRLARAAEYRPVAGQRTQPAMPARAATPVNRGVGWRPFALGAGLGALILAACLLLPPLFGLMRGDPDPAPQAAYDVRIIPPSVTANVATFEAEITATAETGPVAAESTPKPGGSPQPDPTATNTPLPEPTDVPTLPPDEETREPDAEPTGDARATATPPEGFTLALYVETPEFSNLRLREEPTTESQVIANIPYGTQLQAEPEPAADDEGGEWYRVSYKGETGYATAEFLSREAPAR